MRKYNPKIVIASWIPYQTTIGFDVLGHTSVNYFLDIGEDPGGSTWMTDEVHRRTDFELTYLTNIENTLICMYDYIGGIIHNRVRLFKRLIRSTARKSN